MIIDLKTLEKEHPNIYKNGRARVLQRLDQFKREKYYFTLAEKEDWLNSSINIVLRQSQEESGYEYFLFLEKTVRLIELDLIPSCKQTKLIRLSRIKLAASKRSSLAIVFLSEQDKLVSLNFRFASEGLAEQWQKLIYSKKNGRSAVDNNDRGNFPDIRQTKTKLKQCEDELRRVRVEKDEILKHLSIVTEQLCLFKIPNSLVEKDKNQHRRTSIGKFNEVEKKRQQREESSQNKQQQLLRLRLKVEDLQKYKQYNEELFKAMDNQKNGFQRLIADLSNQNQQLRTDIGRLQQERTEMLQLILRRNQQLRTNNIIPSQSVIISNRQDLLRSFESEEVMLSFGP